MNLFVFKVQTVPDIDSCRRIYDLHGLSDEDVAKAVFHKRRQQANSEELQHHLQKIVAISAVLRSSDLFRVWSLGDPESDEAELLKRFYSGIDRYQPELVSWRGNEYDLPIIRVRSLLYPLNAAQLWTMEDQVMDDLGQLKGGFCYRRHTDLSVTLSGQISDSNISLNEVAGLCGFPAQSGRAGQDAWETYLDSNMHLLRSNGEIEVLNTYLVYLRLLINKGQLDAEGFQRECELVRKELNNTASDHLQAFDHAWIDA